MEGLDIHFQLDSVSRYKVTCKKKKTTTNGMNLWTRLNYPSSTYMYAHQLTYC